MGPRQLAPQGAVNTSPQSTCRPCTVRATSTHCFSGVQSHNLPQHDGNACWSQSGFCSMTHLAAKLLAATVHFCPNHKRALRAQALVCACKGQSSLEVQSPLTEATQQVSICCFLLIQQPCSFCKYIHNGMWCNHVPVRLDVNLPGNRLLREVVHCNSTGCTC